jgi:hypothetical protein
MDQVIDGKLEALEADNYHEKQEEEDEYCDDVICVSVTCSFFSWLSRIMINLLSHQSEQNACQHQSQLISNLVVIPFLI